MSESRLVKINEPPCLRDQSVELEINFRKTLHKLGITPFSRFVIGVSGGTDSMALAGLISNFSYSAKINSIAVIVDHGLRPESGAQAIDSKKELERLKLKTKIVKISEKQPSGNIQHWARNQRYRILLSEARMHGGVLMIAHHQDDQIETLYLRLKHDSGLLGLAGMKVQRFHHAVRIIRPLLEQKKLELYSYCTFNNIRTVEDPTNTNLKYDRVRARNHLKRDKLLGNQLLQVSSHVNKIVSVFKRHCADWCQEHIHFEFPIYACFAIAEFNYLPELVRIYILQQMLWQIGAADYPARLNSVRAGIKKIKARKKFTLAGCIVCPRGDIMEIHAERKRFISNPMLIIPHNPAVIDNRWLVKTNRPLNVNQMSDEFYQRAKKDKNLRYIMNKWRYPARLCIPILQDLDGRVIRPHIEECDVNIDVSSGELIGTSPNKTTLVPIRKIPFWNEN